MGPAQLLQQPYPLRLKTSCLCFLTSNLLGPREAFCGAQANIPRIPTPPTSPAQTRQQTNRASIKEPTRKSHKRSQEHTPPRHSSSGCLSWGTTQPMALKLNGNSNSPLGGTPEGEADGAPDSAFPSEDFHVPDVTEHQQEPSRLVLLGLLISL